MLLNQILTHQRTLKTAGRSTKEQAKQKFLKKVAIQNRSHESTITSIEILEFKTFLEGSNLLCICFGTSWLMAKKRVKPRKWPINSLQRDKYCLSKGLRSLKRTYA